MNKKGFAISIVLYSIVFLLITILYMILGTLKTRYHINSDLRNSIMTELNELAISESEMETNEEEETTDDSSNDDQGEIEGEPDNPTGE